MFVDKLFCHTSRPSISKVKVYIIYLSQTKNATQVTLQTACCSISLSISKYICWTLDSAASSYYNKS